MPDSWQVVKTIIMEKQHKLNQILIIPDVHGRTFWRSAVDRYKNRDDAHIVFLGDYLDPYQFEHITSREAISNFVDIIGETCTARNITLLIGNHDLHYFPLFIHDYGCRRIEDVKYDISELFERYRNLFKVAYDIEINRRKYLFTHAGVLSGWLEMLHDGSGTALNDESTWLKSTTSSDADSWLKSVTADAASLNKLLSGSTGMNMLATASVHRGGYSPYGSCIWADVDEHLCSSEHLTDENGNSVYQIFAHSLSRPAIDDYYMTSDFAMLDCRMAFLLDCNTGEITPVAD